MIVFGVIWFLISFIVGASYKPKVIILENKVIEKRIFRKPFIINNFKWIKRGLSLYNTIANVIVLFDEYKFDFAELATYNNSKGKYIIIKENTRNIEILEKVIGGETKL